MFCKICIFKAHTFSLINVCFVLSENGTVFLNFCLNIFFGGGLIILLIYSFTIALVPK